MRGVEIQPAWKVVGWVTQPSQKSSASVSATVLVAAVAGDSWRARHATASLTSSSLLRLHPEDLGMQLQSVR